MSRWKEDFVGNTQRKCVQINHNGDFENGKVLYMDPDWTYLEFLQAASQRLEMVPAAKRMFNADGVEIDDCMMIEDDDILFLSILGDYIPPTTGGSGSTGDDADSSSENKKPHEKVPPMIGGYKVLDLLGKGGFGEVRLGEHQLTGEKVALKFLRKADIHSLGAAERTNIEIQCLTTLKHMNIIRLHQYLESVNHVVLVFELMEGGDLLKYLKNHVKPVTNGKMTMNKSFLSEDEARHIFYQVLCAVSYAHNQHICHRDLKLENILIKQSTGLALVKIADFGLSDFYRPGATMKSNCGTLSFLAPEVLRGTSTAGPPLDVWSMGVILFAVLCGRLPFEGPDLNGTKRPRDAIIKSRINKGQYKVDDNLSADAKDLISKMLQIDPSERASIPEIFNHSWIRSINNSSFHYSEALSLKPAVPGLRGTVPVAAPVIENASPKIGRQTFFSSPKGESRAEAREETNYNSEGIASEAFRSPIISPKTAGHWPRSSSGSNLPPTDSPRANRGSIESSQLSPSPPVLSSIGKIGSNSAIPVSGSGKVMRNLAELDDNMEDSDIFQLNGSNSEGSVGGAIDAMDDENSHVRNLMNKNNSANAAALRLLSGKSCNSNTDSISETLSTLDLDTVPALPSNQNSFKLTPLRRASSGHGSADEELDSITSQTADVGSRNWVEPTSSSLLSNNNNNAFPPSSSRPNTSSHQSRRNSRQHHEYDDDDNESVKSSATEYVPGAKYHHRTSSTAMRRRHPGGGVNQRESITGATSAVDTFHSHVQPFASPVNNANGTGRGRVGPVPHHSTSAIDSSYLSSPVGRVGKHIFSTNPNAVSAGNRPRSLPNTLESRASASLAVSSNNNSSSNVGASVAKPRFNS